MAALPEDVQSRLARAVGAYIRSTPATDLPGPLRRFRGFRPRALPQHGEQLVGALDDDGFRARVLEWLDDDHSGLPRSEEDLLRLATERIDGWEERLRETSEAGEEVAAAPAGIARDELERERAKARRARAEAKKAREDARRAIEAERAALQELARERDELRAALAEAEAAARTARAEAAAVAAAAERDLRKARRDTERARAEKDELRAELRRIKRESSALERRVGRLEERLGAATAAPPRAEPDPPAPARERRPLPVPQGRFEDDPETLEAWLGVPGVHLLVDGYNVTLSEDGFPDLDLVRQRERLLEGLERLAVRGRGPVRVVFDGSDVPPGAGRRPRGRVRVEYSRPGEIADDHLIALLQGLPPEPVVVVTNDRELQDRAAALGASVARSAQLLSLILAR